MMNNVINLHGVWRYELDEKDQGLQQEWYQRLLAEDGFTVPGTTTTNKMGDRVYSERKLSKEAVRCLREEYKYVGAAWYQTHFCINEDVNDKRVWLYLERVIFESSVWIDGYFVGKYDSVSAPHIYEITDYVRNAHVKYDDVILDMDKVKSESVLTVRIDNRDIQKIGAYPSAYTDETQTIWNGIVGRAEIIIADATAVTNLVVGVSEQKKEVRLSFDLCHGISKYEVNNDNFEGNDFENHELESLKNIEACLTVRIMDKDKAIAGMERRIIWSEISERISVVLPLTDEIRLWDEFDPALYTLEIEISGLKERDMYYGKFQKQVGFREISHEDGILLINGIQRFLRGNIDCCVYPHTGYPPMDVEAWKDIFKRTKAYGCNHVRFHSWCPPEAAFEAADQTGMYLQAEGPVWMDNWTGYTVGCCPEHHHYLPKEAMRIINTYSWHPSFCIFSNGNELNGDFDLLESIIGKLKERNPYLLYTLSTNWDRKANRQDDLFIAQSVDGTGIRGQYYLDALVTGTRLEFAEGTAKRRIPVISHEVGQYAVYPNVNEISKYMGVLKPVNLEAIKKDLEEKELLSYVPDFVKTSGELSWLLYKSEIEAAMRTRNLAGIQLLGLHDFPGQSTATVGILDCFYDSKGIGTEEEFRMFCNETVILVKMDKFIFKSGENFIADVEIAHYGKEALRDQCIEISIWDKDQKVIWSSELTAEEIPIGLTGLMSIDIRIFDKLKGRTRLEVRAGIRHTDIRNAWDIWVYGPPDHQYYGSGADIVKYYETFSEEAIQALQQGKNVLLLAKPNHIKDVGPSRFFPVFWSPVHFASSDPCGMIIDQHHSFFTKYFPAKSFADQEWKNLLERGVSINLDHMTGFQPITMFVPNFYHNHRFSNLFEAKVLKGKLLVCSLDLDTENDKCSDNIEIAGFKNAIARYFVSSDFEPKQNLDIKDVKRLFISEETKEADRDKVNKEDSRMNIALNRPAYADSTKSTAYDAGKGNDGNPVSGWMAADAELGHYWQVDLGSEYDVTGIRIIFNEEGNYQYVIHTSLDEKSWELASNQTGQIKTDQVRTDCFKLPARYVRITYNGLPGGVWAGHREFEVYTD